MGPPGAEAVGPAVAIPCCPTATVDCRSDGGSAIPVICGPPAAAATGEESHSKSRRCQTVKPVSFPVPPTGFGSPCPVTLAAEGFMAAAAPPSVLVLSSGEPADCSGGPRA